MLITIQQWHWVFEQPEENITTVVEGIKKLLILL